MCVCVCVCVCDLLANSLLNAFDYCCLILKILYDKNHSFAQNLNGFNYCYLHLFL